MAIEKEASEKDLANFDKIKPSFIKDLRRDYILKKEDFKTFEIVKFEIEYNNGGNTLRYTCNADDLVFLVIVAEPLPHLNMAAKYQRYAQLDESGNEMPKPEPGKPEEEAPAE